MVKWDISVRNILFILVAILIAGIFANGFFKNHIDDDDENKESQQSQQIERQ